MCISAKGSTIGVFFFALTVSSTLMSVAYAHSPHDVITSIAISPYYENDQTVFIDVFGELKKSSDGGNSWRNLEYGLDNNALVSDIVAAPRGPDQFDTYVSTRGDGVYRSSDQGVRWHPVNHGLTDLYIRFLASSSGFAHDRTLVAVPQGKGLFISTDAGYSWEPCVNADFLATTVLVLETNGGIRLLVGTDKGEIYLSGESFNHWMQQGRITDSGTITGFTVRAGSNGSNGQPLVFVGTERSGLYATADLGVSFSRIELPSNGGSREKDAYVTSVLEFNEAEAATELFVTLWHESVYWSVDGGENWTWMNAGLKKDRQADETGEPHFSKVVVPDGYSRHGEAFIAGFAGLFKTGDKGRSWREMETRQARNVEGLAVSPFFAKDQLLALASYDAGAYFSQDAGKTWQANNFGLRSVHVWDVAASSDVADNALIFFGNNLSLNTYSDVSSACSRNDVLSTPLWKFMTASFDPGSLIMKVARRFLKKPEQIFITQITPSPKFAQDKTLFMGTRYLGIMKSTDAGSTWIYPWDERVWVTSCKVSPDFATDEIVVAATRLKGVYFSSDGGVTWQTRNKGLSAQAVNYQNLGSSVLEFSSGFAKDRRLFYGTADGLYLTTDNAENWEEVDVTGKGQREHIKAIGISPGFADDGIMLVSVKGHGLFKSNNGGKSFFEIAPDLIQDSQLFKLIRFSPDFLRDNTIFAASVDEIYVSNDGGTGWSRLDRPVRYENTKENFIYSDGWRVLSDNAYSTLNIHASNIPGSTVDFYFVGRQVTWYGPKSRTHGMANLYVDGEFVARIDQFNSELKSFEPIHTINNLSYGAHRLSIEVLDEKNAQATDRIIAVDALDVY